MRRSVSENVLLKRLLCWRVVGRRVWRCWRWVGFLDARCESGLHQIFGFRLRAWKALKPLVCALKMSHVVWENGRALKLGWLEKSVAEMWLEPLLSQPYRLPLGDDDWLR